MTRFDGQVVIVTGAASGIGLGIARAFHDAGASVVLGDVREDALDQARATFSDQERLAFVPVDVRDAAAVANLVATAEQAFGPPAVMIANAGIVPNASVLNMDVSAWDAVIETNLRGVFLSCQAAARSMVAHETRGRIVTISSIAHSYGRLGASAYCASKAGVVVTIVVQASKIVVQTTKTWHSTLPSANSEIRKSVEHGGFEPPTPCLPEKWLAFRGVVQTCFGSSRVRAPFRRDRLVAP